MAAGEKAAQRHARISDLFIAALDISDAERDAWLSSQCGDDPALRGEVEALLAQDEQPGRVDQPVFDSALLAEFAKEDGGAPPRGAPRRIGCYDVVGVLGHGGMGVVYRARQSHPDRHVALKVVAAPFVTPGLIKRFEVEAQLLGRLKHPGIAQIYDAGADELNGRPTPYFAMELVEGAPLTEYAHKARLDVRARLKLLLRVCDAVAHAHQRGVIHRDLKPGNILVDESGEPKVLDFGVARTTDVDLQMTAQTRTGELVGTLPYMSPEQVSGRTHDIDTRTDVYALGVVAFELLTGRLPYELANRSMVEAARIIQEQAPTRISAIQRLLSGDLETILLTALEKDRERRYASVAEFAADLRRFLRQEPITARPPSMLYQLRKFAARNRVLVGGAAATMVALVVGIVGTSYGLIRAQQERDAALEAQAVATGAKERAEYEAKIALAVNSFLNRMFESINPYGDTDVQARPDVTVREVLDHESARIDGAFPNQPGVEAALRTTIGIAYKNLAELKQAEQHLRRALELRRTADGPASASTARAMRELAGVLVQSGQVEAALPLYEESARLDLAIGPPGSFDIAMGQARYGWALMTAERLEEAETHLRAALPALRAHAPESDDAYAGVLGNLARVRRLRGDLTEAYALYQQTRDALAKLHAEDDPLMGTAHNNLALVAFEKGDVTAARDGWERAAEILRKRMGADHPRYADTLNNLSMAYFDLGELDRAEQCGRDAVAIYEQRMGAQHPETIFCMRNFAVLLMQRDKFAEALPLFTRVREFYRDQLGAEHWRTVRADGEYAEAWAATGHFAEAEPVMVRAFERLCALRPLPDRFTASIGGAAVRMYERVGDLERAAAIDALLPPKDGE